MKKGEVIVTTKEPEHVMRLANEGIIPWMEVFDIFLEFHLEKQREEEESMIYRRRFLYHS